MSFREKHLCISIFSTLVVWSVYFRELIDRILRGSLTDPAFAGTMGLGFVGAVFVVVMIEVGLTLFATFTTPRIERDTRDEREMLASLKAGRVSLSILGALIVTVALIAYFGGLVGGNLVEGRAGLITDVNLMVLLANVLVACVIVAELARSSVTLALLRGLR